MCFAGTPTIKAKGLHITIHHSPSTDEGMVTNRVFRKRSCNSLKRCPLLDHRSAVFILTTHS